MINDFQLNCEDEIKTHRYLITIKVLVGYRVRIILEKSRLDVIRYTVLLYE